MNPVQNPKSTINTTPVPMEIDDPPPKMPINQPMIDLFANWGIGK